MRFALYKTTISDKTFISDNSFIEFNKEINDNKINKDMKKLEGNNLKEVMSKNDGEIHINDIIHWADEHNYYVYSQGFAYDDNCENEFESYLIQDVSAEEDKEASDGAILYFDSNAILHSHQLLN